MAVERVSVDTTPLLEQPGGTATVCHLLWGDRVVTLGKSGAYTSVKARGRQGYVRTTHLGGQSLLEFYFIDVGQGDGVLVRTPDDRHILIDGGFARQAQPSGKNAADFVDWKFVKDYGQRTIALDAVIASHNDADHYGGLHDLLSDDPADTKLLDAQDVTVEAFYHAGLSWWKKGTTRELGPHVASDDGPMWTRLLQDRASVTRATGSGPGPKLAGQWGELFEAVLATKTAAGSPTPIQRLGHTSEFLPGFEPGSGQVSVKVLAPVEFTVAGKPALRRFSGGDSKNTNGQSILLRIDYGRCRVVLTGDLNTAAQSSLLNDYTGNVQELECDVAKACHHGSDDVSYRFLQALRPAVTVISSGDNEGHDHPRPSIVAASATTGYLRLNGDELESPLIYSTEIARSLKLSKATSIEIPSAGEDPLQVKGQALSRSKVNFAKKKGEKTPPYKTFDEALLVSGLIYGLVNVRTDGDKILCATMNESKKTWQIKTIRSRF